MFDFLFKRVKRSAGQSPKTQPQPQVPEQAVAAVSRRAEQIALAHTFSGDDAGALACVLQSEFADVRLAAAQHVHAQPMMEQLHQAMRNTDRRVAKLMQSRLDVIRHEQAEQQRAEACIDDAGRMLQDLDLSPNQVAELDRRWQVIQAPAQLSGQFAALRSALCDRIDAQVALQRAVIDAVAGLRQLAGAGLSKDEAAFALARYASEHAVHGAAFEARSLPRQLLREFASALQHGAAALADSERQQGAVDARQAALTQWQQSDPAELGADQLKRAWQNLPGLPDSAASMALQQQFDALLDAIPAPVIKPKRAAAGIKDAGADFTQALDAMDAALQQGLLQVAAEHDKLLHDSKGSRLTPAQSERLAHVRAEFKRLADWARWGGNVSREELVKAVEELPALPNGELAKKIGSLRACWKSLDSMSGAAPKALWLRFDAACELAYAPVAAHFKVLADERHANAGRAQALIAEIMARIENPGQGDGKGDDWKSLAADGSRLRQAWTRLGTIDRKEKKQLDGEFGKALDALLAPLDHQREIEMARREQLIVEVGLLQANQRNTTATLRALQEKWQEYAKALPLERHAEQALWQRFRAACDQVFAQRKESASLADGERRIHLHDKEAVCAGLEAADGPELEQAGSIPGLLRDAQQAWNAIGAVPHASEQKIAQRYQAAVALLQSRVDASARRAGAAQVDALQHKLRLCQALESALCSVDVDAERDSVPWTARWSALPPLGAHYEAALLSRFAAGVQALDHQAGAHALQLERNRAALLTEVLRLEIAAGIDSGAEFARERLKMQVETLQSSLQSSLKSGQKQAPAAAPFLQLCALPALADMRTTSRIEQLLRSSGAMESR
jgi:hypothetical protein